MFTTVSMTGVGGIIALLELVLPWFGVTIPDETLAQAIGGLASFISVALIVIGQIRRPDLKFGIFRK